MQARAGVQAAAFEGFDLVEDAQAALHDQAQLPARAAGQAVHQGRAAIHGGAGPVGAVGNQARVFACALQGQQLGLAGAMEGAVGTRQVVAVAGDVHRQVLPEVDELQRSADRIALLQRLRVAHAIQVQKQPPHRVGGAAAVVQQFGAVGIAFGIAGFFHILGEGAEQVFEQRHGQLVAAQHALQRQEHIRPAGRGRLPLRNRVQVGQVGRQVVQAGGRCGVAFIGNVVGRAGKGVDGGNRLAQVRRAQQRGDREVFVVRHGCGQGRGGRRRGGGTGRSGNGCSCRGRWAGGVGGAVAVVHTPDCRLTRWGRFS